MVEMLTDCDVAYSSPPHAQTDHARLAQQYEEAQIQLELLQENGSGDEQEADARAATASMDVRSLLDGELDGRTQQQLYSMRAEVEECVLH
jgi:hypothetical protein